MKTLCRRLRQLPISAALGWLILLFGALPGQADFGGCCSFFVGGCQTTTKANCPQEVGKWTCLEVCENKMCVEGRSDFTCVGGTRPGEECQVNADCPGGLCQGRVFRCKGGATPGKVCLVDPDCAPGTCEADGVAFAATGSTAGAVSPICENDPPICGVANFYSGLPTRIDIGVNDPGSGVGGISIISAENADVTIPAFEVGTHEQVRIPAIKIDQTQASRVEIRAVDLAGNFTVCDPILTEVLRGTGKPQEQTFKGIDATEDTVRIDNGDPGLKQLEVEVNGWSFRVKGLRAGETRTIDVTQALLPGNQNVITLKSTGKPGSSASVLIWDGGQ